MFKKAIAALVMVALSSSALSVNASEAPTITVGYSAQTGEITVRGKAQGRSVITVAPEALTPDKMSDDEGFTPTVFKQFSADGSYSYTIGMPDTASGGRYKVYISNKDGSADDVFVYMDTIRSETIIPLLNSADNDDFNHFILDNALTLGIDKEDELFIDKQSDILMILDNMIFASPIDFYNKYSKVYALSTLKGQTNDKVLSYLEQFQMQLGIDMKADFEEDARLDSEISEKFLALLSQVDFSKEIGADGDINFKACFEKMKPLAAVESATNWVTLKEVIISSFSDVFSDLLKDEYYVLVKDKDNVFERLMKERLDTYENISSSFSSVSKYVYELEKRSENKPSSSSGSSSRPVSVPLATESQSANKNVFTDLASDHWSAAAVNTLVSRNVIIGYEDGSFKPSQKITRAEFVKMISGFLADDDCMSCNFEDVAQDAWYFKAVCKASSQSIVNGDGDRFYPEVLIKREDAALIIYRILSACDKAPYGYKPFADRKDISDYAKDAVYALGGAGIVSGSGNDMFLPLNPITRAEAAQLIYNAFVR